MRKQIILFCIIFLTCSFRLSAQIEKTKNFIGLTPSATVEPYYAKGEFDLNIVPIVFQKTLTKRIDIKIASIINYGVRNSTNSISHLGGQLSFPIFFRKKKDLNTPSQGFYIAPGGGYARNIMEKHNNYGPWLEPGYNLMISKNWSISFGVHLGATHFNYDNGDEKWDNHFGITIIIGRWI